MGPPFPRQPSIVEGAGGGGRRQLLQGQGRVARGCRRTSAAWCVFGGGNGNWSRTAEEEDGGVAVGRERLEVSGWAGHAEDKIDLFGAIIIL